MTRLAARTGLAVGNKGAMGRAVTTVRPALRGHDRRAAEQRGRLAEWVAMALLICKGYRILDRRHRTRLGEIDIIAVRGTRLAFVEVKARRTLAEGQQALAGGQAQRIGEAAEQWVWKRPAYRSHLIGLDAILLAPWSLPRHAENAMQHI